MLAACPAARAAATRYGRCELARSGPADEAAADLLCDAELATGKGACPCDRITGTAIPQGFCLEQSQHPLRAIRCPPRDDPPVSFAQRLRRSHTRILPLGSLLPLVLVDRSGLGTRVGDKERVRSPDDHRGVEEQLEAGDELTSLRSEVPVEERFQLFLLFLQLILRLQEAQHVM
jgi:hypothetical protein